MGRAHENQFLPPLTTKHAKDRPSRKATRIPTSEVFSIQRPLATETALQVEAGLRMLHAGGDLPLSVETEAAPVAPLMPLDFFAHKARSGLVRPKTAHLQKKLRQRCRHFESKSIDAEITGVKLRYGAQLTLTLESAQLEEERAKISELLGWYGIRGLQREEQGVSPHIIIARADKLVSWGERKLLEDMAAVALDAVCHFEEPVELLPWEMPLINRQAA